MPLKKIIQIKPILIYTPVPIKIHGLAMQISRLKMVNFGSFQKIHPGLVVKCFSIKEILLLLSGTTEVWMQIHM